MEIFAGDLCMQRRSDHGHDQLRSRSSLLQGESKRLQLTSHTFLSLVWSDWQSGDGAQKVLLVSRLCKVEVTPEIFFYPTTRMIIGWVMFVYREDSAEVAMSTVNGKVVLIKYHFARKYHHIGRLCWLSSWLNCTNHALQVGLSDAGPLYLAFVASAPPVEDPWQDVALPEGLRYEEESRT